MVSILNYGIGNLGSIVNMLKHIGIPCSVISRSEEIQSARKLLLPGVGAFDVAMNMIRSKGFEQVLVEKALGERVPVLGICLGMQLLTRGSEEGKVAGLGLVKGETVRFPYWPDRKVPHMGWNAVKSVNQSPLTNDLSNDARFYFVHSYYVRTDIREHCIMECEYGLSFDAVIQQDNIYGAQFHPEKSHHFGMKFLKNFADL